MTTLAGSVSIDGAGVATGSGMAKTLYDLFIATPQYAAIVVNPTLGYTVASVVAARRKLAELVNTMSAISDGPRWIPTTLKTSSYAAAPWEYVKYNTVSGGFTITLPDPTTVPAGVAIRLKNASFGTNTLTVSAVGGSTIESFGSVTQVKAIECIEYTSDGSNWWISAAYNE